MGTLCSAKWAINLSKVTYSIFLIHSIQLTRVGTSCKNSILLLMGRLLLVTASAILVCKIIQMGAFCSAKGSIVGDT